MEDKVRNMTFIGKISAYLLLIVSLYYSTFQYLWGMWQVKDYSHIYLIPFVIGYILWEKRKEFESIPVKRSWQGIIPFFFGILLFWIGELGGEYLSLNLSLWFLILGLQMLNTGTQLSKKLMFVYILLLTMIPLPRFLYNHVSLNLKLASSKLGVLFMQLMGMSAHCEGNIIDLGFSKLQVVDACSGLRYLFPMIVLSIIVVYFTKITFWKKALVVVSSIPLTILTNSLRIALTGILASKFGLIAIEGFFHDFEGWLIFMFTLSALLFEVWLFNKVITFGNHDNMEHEEPNRINIDSVSMPKKRIPVFHNQFALSLIILLVNIIFIHSFEFREKKPLVQSFSLFPMTMGIWEGKNQTMEQRIIETLDLSDYVMSDYKDPSGKAINFYVAYYESQRKGESIHSPATCLRGGGWEFKQSIRKEIMIDGKKTMPVNQAIIEKGSLKEIAYYWFPSRGRNLTNVYQMKFFNFWDALTRHRTDGALVRLITQIYPDETLESAEKRMTDFISDIEPVLKTYLPQ
ncbi:MAG: VPLPA-CTERM-specific exosortase XrtD [Proteobacteria bacterium]|nr:VPLPA-CTERM-specific exosortase XrtD [Pseudomonadota bacterium]